MLLLRNLKVYAEDQIFPNGYVLIDEEKIVETGESFDSARSDKVTEMVFDPSHQLIPGMIDLHIHGAGGADTMDATNEALETMAHLLPKEGTTSFLATTMTVGQRAIEAAIENIANFMKNSQGKGKAEILGIHLEGPFLSPERAGAQHPDHIIEPDVELFKKWQEAGNHTIRLVTLAPERNGGLGLASYLKETGVVASIGHSDATHAEVNEGVEAGITHATHLYNGMSPLHHREPGVVGSVLLEDRITSEMIVDGIHIAPAMVKLAYRNKGRERVVLVTDAMRAKCLNDGYYDLGGQEVEVKDGKATLQNGTLAGSILRMRDAVQNMISFTGCKMEDIIQMTSVNPAKEMNVFDRKGSIKSDKDADIVILDDQNEVILTICRGKIAFMKEGLQDEVN
ncbi:N-acetylglucosamine-6-phosphate deacetylase [Metabacillus sp. RGM 3146]|uniref:N-acetylglucosamine-6-phosphate deacetylase n=1 Tax=Metabacillus sp. RGM 3146 TaxID=3401092 RepID=UPI003B9ACAA9